MTGCFALHVWQASVSYNMILGTGSRRMPGDHQCLKTWPIGWTMLLPNIFAFGKGQVEGIGNEYVVRLDQVIYAISDRTRTARLQLRNPEEATRQSRGFSQELQNHRLGADEAVTSVTIIKHCSIITQHTECLPCRERNTLQE